VLHKAQQYFAVFASVFSIFNIILSHNKIYQERVVMPKFFHCLCGCFNMPKYQNAQEAFEAFKKYSCLLDNKNDCEPNLKLADHALKACRKFGDEVARNILISEFYAQLKLLIVQAQKGNLTKVYMGLHSGSLLLYKKVCIVGQINYSELSFATLIVNFKNKNEGLSTDVAIGKVFYKVPETQQYEEVYLRAQDSLLEYNLKQIAASLLQSESETAPLIDHRKA
jgi:hypothetical protein